MSGKMRIGEMLLIKERIDPWVLTNTLKEQAATRQRLISILVKRALLDHDEGAMLLSEQLGYPAAMERHLERRDDRLLSIIPPELGARWVVLPIARAKTGAIVVCARDPSPILQSALEHALKEPVILAVTPAVVLERLVRAAYGLTAPEREDEPLPDVPPSVNDIGSFRIEDTPPPLAMRRPRTVSDMFILSRDPELPPTRAPVPIAPLEAVLDEIDRVHNAAAVERLVIAYTAKRWHRSLLVIVTGDELVGHKGHDVPHIERLAFPLASLSMLRIAHDTRKGTLAHPASRVQLELDEALGNAKSPGAAPVIVEGRVVAVLAVGDPLPDGPRDPRPELDRLVDALAAAYIKFGR
ncbi:MAG: hypothetical protein JO257_08390 [Deltaproteobacteria bacterium]|nr:hypothetical protein [Deltaproteobacteria bacterium]